MAVARHAKSIKLYEQAVVKDPFIEKNSVILEACSGKMGSLAPLKEVIYNQKVDGLSRQIALYEYYKDKDVSLSDIEELVDSGLYTMNWYVGMELFSLMEPSSEGCDYLIRLLYNTSSLKEVDRSVNSMYFACVSYIAIENEYSKQIYQALIQRELGANAREYLFLFLTEAIELGINEADYAKELRRVIFNDTEDVSLMCIMAETMAKNEPFTFSAKLNSTKSLLKLLEKEKGTSPIK
jgi:hypothetical protein